MRRILSGFLAVIMMISFSACFNSGKGDITVGAVAREAKKGTTPFLLSNESKDKEIQLYFDNFEAALKGFKKDDIKSFLDLSNSTINNYVKYLDNRDMKDLFSFYFENLDLNLTRTIIDNGHMYAVVEVKYLDNRYNDFYNQTIRDGIDPRTDFYRSIEAATLDSLKQRVKSVADALIIAHPEVYTETEVKFAQEDFYKISSEPIMLPKQVSHTGVDYNDRQEIAKWLQVLKSKEYADGIVMERDSITNYTLDLDDASNEFAKYARDVSESGAKIDMVVGGEADTGSEYGDARVQEMLALIEHKKSEAEKAASESQAQLSNFHKSGKLPIFKKTMLIEMSHGDECSIMMFDPADVVILFGSLPVFYNLNSIYKVDNYDLFWMATQFLSEESEYEREALESYSEVLKMSDQEFIDWYRAEFDIEDIDMASIVEEILNQKQSNDESNSDTQNGEGNDGKAADKDDKQDTENASEDSDEDRNDVLAMSDAEILDARGSILPYKLSFLINTYYQDMSKYYGRLSEDKVYMEFISLVRDNTSFELLKQDLKDYTVAVEMPDLTLIAMSSIGKGGLEDINLEGIVEYMKQEDIPMRRGYSNLMLEAYAGNDYGFRFVDMPILRLIKDNTSSIVLEYLDIGV